MITRDFVHTLTKRIQEPDPLIQVILGPRQVGKTTGVYQMLDHLSAPSLYVSADDTLSVSNLWIQEKWQEASEKGEGTVLVIDEIQKIPNWAEAIKRLWDEQKRKSQKIKCVILGSSSLSLQKGLTESLTGRFELISVYHWNYEESREAFGYDLDTYMRFGGYPGAHVYVQDYPRWFSFLKSSVVDTVIGQDILSQIHVSKPALFRQAFEILSSHPAEDISYSKLLGQLQDRGNTDLIKHYLEIYEGAYFFRGLSKYSLRPLKSKTSSPKIIPLCPVFYTLAVGPHALDDPEKRGRVFEALVGADLLRIAGAKIYYWREGTQEVDFVVVHENKLLAIEVKSGRKRSREGLNSFQKRFPKSKICFITTDNYAKFSQAPLAYLKEAS